MQLYLNFPLDPDIVATAQAKHTYAISFLRGKAADWFRPHAKPRLPINFVSFQEFLDRLRAGFAYPNKKASAERKILGLKQEGYISAYNSKLISYATVLDRNDVAKLSAYNRSLNNDLTDSLVEHLDLPTNYQEYINGTICLGNQLYDRKQQRKNKTNNPTTKKNDDKVAPAVRYTTTTTTSTATDTHLGPMDTSAFRLSAEE
jgi:hypothetical protein